MCVEDLSKSEFDSYLHDGAARCPYCRSTSIEGEGVIIDAGTASQDMFCQACQESWTDVYRLSRVEIYVPDQAA